MVIILKRDKTAKLLRRRRQTQQGMKWKDGDRKQGPRRVRKLR